jgi:hypothetical protein
MPRMTLLIIDMLNDFFRQLMRWLSRKAMLPNRGPVSAGRQVSSGSHRRH